MQGHLIFRLTRQVVRVSLSQLQARVLSTSNLAKALGCPSSKSTFRVEPDLIIMFFFSLFGLLLPTETKDSRPNI
jgi:hypothetical protein